MPTTLRNTDILFHDGTTQSTAATGVSTTYGAVGTYVIAGYNLAANASLAIGTTVAGSTLFRSQDAAAGSDNFTALNAWSGYSSPGTYSYLVGPTTLSLSGTWRNMTRLVNGTSATSNYILALWVRVS